MAALVTIGIPFRDEGQMLELAIRSVFAQTYENWELILIDDGADDATRSIVESVRHDRVRLVGDGLNLGLATRLNQIARLANGKYCSYGRRRNASKGSRSRLVIWNNTPLWTFLNGNLRD